MDFGGDILQYGALGLALALIFLIALILKYVYTLIAENLRASNEVILKNVEAMGTLTNVIERNTQNVNRSIEVMKRVEHHLDKGCER